VVRAPDGTTDVLLAAGTRNVHLGRRGLLRALVHALRASG